MSLIMMQSTRFHWILCSTWIPRKDIRNTKKKQYCFSHDVLLVNDFENMCHDLEASLVAQIVKNLPAIKQTWAQSLGWEDPLEMGMATHSSILPWRIPLTEEPSRLQSMGSQRVGHDWVTTFSTVSLYIFFKIINIFYILVSRCACVYFSPNSNPNVHP